MTTGDVQIPGTYTNAGGGSSDNRPGSGTFLGLVGAGVTNGPTGNGTYNPLGGDPYLNPGIHYDFATRQIVPEPGSLLLAGLGGIGLLLAHKRRGGGLLAKRV